jgi:hypothetical protein
MVRAGHVLIAVITNGRAPAKQRASRPHQAQDVLRSVCRINRQREEHHGKCRKPDHTRPDDHCAVACGPPAVFVVNRIDVWRAFGPIIDIFPYVQVAETWTRDGSVVPIGMSAQSSSSTMSMRASALVASLRIGQLSRVKIRRMLCSRALQASQARRAAARNPDHACASPVRPRWHLRGSARGRRGRAPARRVVSDR